MVEGNIPHVFNMIKFHDSPGINHMFSQETGK